jgi:hypothetical protein
MYNPTLRQEGVGREEWVCTTTAVRLVEKGPAESGDVEGNIRRGNSQRACLPKVLDRASSPLPGRRSDSPSPVCEGNILRFRCLARRAPIAS